MLPVLCVALVASIGVRAQWNYAQWDAAFRAAPEKYAAVDSAAALIERTYLYNRPDSAIIIADRILDHGISLGDSLVQLKGWYWKGAALHQTGAFDSAEVCLQKALSLATGLHSVSFIAETYLVLGFIQEGRGNVQGALDRYSQILKVLDEGRSTDSLLYAGAYLNIAFLYQEIGLLSLAEDYIGKYQHVLGNSPKVERNVNSFKGEVAVIDGRYEEALSWFEKGLAAAERSGNKLQIVTSRCYVGEQKMKLGSPQEAKADFLAGVRIAHEIGNEEWWARMKASLGELAQREGHFQEAKEQSEAALKVADRIGDRRTQHDACKTLFAACRSLGMAERALAYNDRVVDLEKDMRVDELANATLRREFAVKLVTDSLQNERELLKAEMVHQRESAEKDRARNILIAAGLLLLVLAFGLYRRMHFIHKARVRLEREKERSDELLLNILPAEVAEELKRNGEAPAKNYELVSILFTDFKDFTQASEKLNAVDLVAEVNTCFKAFDGITGKYGIEKIKTIGDAYMCAGGIPVPSAGSTRNTVLAALEMQAFMAARKQEREAMDLPTFEMRCGIHTGPVVAGIVGVKKFQYDLWGDTVNTASRMESSGEVGQVNISEATYELVKNEPGLAFTPRGKVQAKGKGEMEMYFVKQSLSLE